MVTEQISMKTNSCRIVCVWGTDSLVEPSKTFWPNKVTIVAKLLLTRLLPWLSTVELPKTSNEKQPGSGRRFRAVPDSFRGPA